MVIAALALIVDPMAAARAGAGLVPRVATGAVIARPVVHHARLRHRALLPTTHKRAHATATKPARKVTARKVTARREKAPKAGLPAPPPTPCAAVVATVLWPRGWDVRCAGPRVGLLGLTNPSGWTTLFVRADESLSTLHVVALHEAGHAWDLARLTHGHIAAWCAHRGCDAAHFFSGGAGGAGWGQPGGAEDWAAVWDACHGGEYHRSYLGLAPPSPADCAWQNALVGYPVQAGAST